MFELDNPANENYIKGFNNKHGLDSCLKFWLPLLGLYTGATLAELSQLHTSDIKEHQDFWVRVHDPIFYLYSVSFHRGGKIRAGVHGKDGIGFMRVILNGKMIYYQKIDCEMQLRGILKTVHLGI